MTSHKFDYLCLKMVNLVALFMLLSSPPDYVKSFMKTVGAGIASSVFQWCFVFSQFIIVKLYKLSMVCILSFNVFSDSNNPLLNHMYAIVL